MASKGISRRGVLAGTPLIAGASLASMSGLSTGAAPSMSPGEANERLTDPATRARVRARVTGSCGEEMSYKFFRLNVYGFMGDGNLIPFFTMNHISAGKWWPIEGHRYRSRLWECGYYCKFDTDDALDVWKNPVTDEELEVFHFVGGPFHINTGPDGLEVDGKDHKPQGMRMEAIADQMIVPTAAGAARPNRVDKKKHPESWSGPTNFVESQATFAANIDEAFDEAFDENLTSAPAFCHFQNLISWHPMLRMGDRPGRTYGNARGAKIRELREIPASILADFEKYTPDIFDLDNWTEPRDGVMDFFTDQGSNRL